MSLDLYIYTIQMSSSQLMLLYLVYIRSYLHYVEWLYSSLFIYEIDVDITANTPARDGVSSYSIISWEMYWDIFLSTGGIVVILNWIWVGWGSLVKT